MEYVIIRRTKFEGSNISDILSIKKTAQSLEEALKYRDHSQIGALGG